MGGARRSRAGPSLSSTPLDRLTAVLSCNICYEAYKDESCMQPRLLRCGHTFCTACIEKTISHQRITCPKCRRKMKVSRGALTFKRNFLAIEVADELMRARAVVDAARTSAYRACVQCEQRGHDRKMRICHTCQQDPETRLCVDCARDWHADHEVVKPPKMSTEREKKSNGLLRGPLKLFSCFVGGG